MKRVEILYAGQLYTLPDTEPAIIETQILEAVQSGTPLWLTVNQGEGSLRVSRILIAVGIPVAVTGIDPEHM
jgi:hypothetical protein